METMREEISSADVEIAHWVPVPNNPRDKNIIVQSVPRGKRDAVLQKARKTCTNRGSLGFAQASIVFVNEHLFPDWKKLLGQAVSKREDASWKFVWVRNAQIFARKDEASPK